jgi:hypothetical protein
MPATRTPGVNLAGPDISFPHAPPIGARKKRICADRGFEGAVPLDAKLDPDTLPKRRANYLIGSTLSFGLPTSCRWLGYSMTNIIVYLPTER